MVAAEFEGALDRGLPVFVTLNKHRKFEYTIPDLIKKSGNTIGGHGYNGGGAGTIVTPFTQHKLRFNAVSGANDHGVGKGFIPLPQPRNTNDTVFDKWERWRHPFMELGRVNTKNGQQSYNRALPAWMHSQKHQYGG